MNLAEQHAIYERRIACHEGDSRQRPSSPASAPLRRRQQDRGSGPTRKSQQTPYERCLVTWSKCERGDKDREKGGIFVGQTVPERASARLLAAPHSRREIPQISVRRIPKCARGVVVGAPIRGSGMKRQQERGD